VPIYPDLRVVEYLRYRAALKGVPAKLRRAAVEPGDGQGRHRRRRPQAGRPGLARLPPAGRPRRCAGRQPADPDPRRADQRASTRTSAVRIKQVVRELADEHTVLFSSHILSRGRRK
jgi:ABC-2 type transport system ATP-binding protein